MMHGASMPAGWPCHFNYAHKSAGVRNSRGAKAMTAHKAQEMLDHPPAGQPMTKQQRGYFQAVAHGWTPTRKRR